MVAMAWPVWLDMSRWCDSTIETCKCPCEFLAAITFSHCVPLHSALLQFLYVWTGLKAKLGLNLMFVSILYTLGWSVIGS